MRLKSLFVRFYKSFNFDYLRKNHPNAEHAPWDRIGNAFFPFVRVTLDPQITTVVGANESGKSHLLSAIEKAVSGEDIMSEDFCRYSEFFTVAAGEMRTPDFGSEWTLESEDERAKIRELCNAPATQTIDHFCLFRTSGGEVRIYLPSKSNKDGFTTHVIQPQGIAPLLPRTFHIDSQIGLPDSVSLHDLINGPDNASGLQAMERDQRATLFEAARSLVGTGSWFETAQTLQTAAGQVIATIGPIARMLTPPRDHASEKEQKMRLAQIKLARDLVLKVARIDTRALEQLKNALQNGNDGYANGIIEKINLALAKHLNFPRFWVQDRDFSLIVSPRDLDLVFTIRDRTGTQYSFRERSSGLKYFLSYYIQYLSHEPKGPETEILLMDEPDAFLSSQAQQDLLKVFAAYASPEEVTRRKVQVIYVTHSPFLIDKNHADRIRVLEKGVADEGTRVVRDVARNHYEPLRSAFGAFVGETTFIGNCNLMVEGPADQILLAGVANYLRRRLVGETETLDLNRLTLVPAGSASHIPYLVYLARGRDIERPAVIVLLDSDSQGDQVRKGMKKGGPHRKQLLRPSYILQVGELPIQDQGGKIAAGERPVEIEDLIPLSLCALAARRYAREFCGLDDALVSSITPESIQERITAGASIYDAIEKRAAALGEDIHIDKTGFARALLAELPEVEANGDRKTNPAGIEELEANMKILFRRLRDMQNQAEKELLAERVSHKIDRMKAAFAQDHPDRATREQAGLFLRDVEETLDDTVESDTVRDAIRAVRREFQLDQELLRLVEDYPNFLDRIGALEYAGRLATQESGPNPEPEETLPTSPDPATAQSKVQVPNGSH